MHFLIHATRYAAEISSRNSRDLWGDDDNIWSASVLPNCVHRWRYDDDNAGPACEAEGRLDSGNVRRIVPFASFGEHDSIKSWSASSEPFWVKYWDAFEGKMKSRRLFAAQIVAG